MTLHLHEKQVLDNSTLHFSFWLHFLHKSSLLQYFFVVEPTRWKQRDACIWCDYHLWLLKLKIYLKAINFKISIIKVCACVCISCNMWRILLIFSTSITGIYLLLHHSLMNGTLELMFKYSMDSKQCFERRRGKLVMNYHHILGKLMWILPSHL